MSKLTFAVALLLVGAFSASRLLSSTGHVVAKAPAFNLPVSQSCADGLQVQFSSDTDAPTLWNEAWVDLSLVDNGFVPGTFLGKSAGVGSFILAGISYTTEGVYRIPIAWPGIMQGVPHYWRVNLRYGDTWYPSPTQSFVSGTCPGGAPSGVSPTPAAALPPVSLQTGDVQRRLDDLERRVDRLDDLASQAPYTPPEASRIDSLESQLQSLRLQVDSLEQCLQGLYVDRWGDVGC